jgi:hypothetical protein
MTPAAIAFALQVEAIHVPKLHGVQSALGDRSEAAGWPNQVRKNFLDRQLRVSGFFTGCKKGAVCCEAQWLS